MSLPWVRLDSNIASHDKVLDAIGERGGKAALAVYMFSLGWSGGHATDGHIPRAALPMLHGTRADAAILEGAGLWDPDPDGNGWWIHNYAQRQETAEITEVKREQASRAGRKSGCVRRGHPKGCTCWTDAPVLDLLEGGTRR